MGRASPPDRGLYAIAALFVANGLGAPGFLARLPERQADLGLSDMGLGLALTGLAVGALVSSPVAGRLVGTIGSRRVVLVSGVLLGGSLWTVAAAPSPPAFFAALALVGAVDAAMDIAMNADGAAFEARVGRSVLHRLHAAWSGGALLGAAAAGLAVAVGLPLTVHLALVGGVGVLVTVGAGRRLPGERVRPVPIGPPVPVVEAGGRRRRRVPPTALVVLAVAIVGGAVVESAPADWAAIQLERFGTGAGAATVGLAAFMAGMVAGRLAGDLLTDRWGGAAVLRWGMALTAAGLAAGAATGHPVVFAVGLAAAGAGCSGFFPLAFSAAARMAGVPPGMGAATVSLAARLGFLAAPVLIGWVAQVGSLRLAFCLVAAVAAIVATAARLIVPTDEARSPALSPTETA